MGIIQFLKYLPQILLLFRDISSTLEQETGDGRPWYASRRFIGICFTAISVIVFMIFGVSLDQVSLNLLADNWITTVTVVVTTVIPAITTLWGILLTIWGQIKAKKPVQVAGVKG